MNVYEFNWNTKDVEEIEDEIEAIERAWNITTEDLQELKELGIDSEEEMQDHLSELKDMLEKAKYKPTYDEYMADIIHDDEMLGLNKSPSRKGEREKHERKNGIHYKAITRSKKRIKRIK